MRFAVVLLACFLAAPLASAEPTAEETRGLSAFAWDCEDLRVVSKNEGHEKLWLFLPDRTLELPLVQSGSGAKYTDDDVVFWLKGEEQALFIDGERMRRCGVDRRASVWEDAKLRGLDFRAVGNEPGWLLELGPEKLVFVYDYGTRRVEAPRPDAQNDSEARRSVFSTKVEKLPFELVLEGRPCEDVMSGESFPVRVEIDWGDRHYVGCGRGLH